MKICHSLETRNDVIDAIKAAGEYITDHAENILGEYPSGLVELNISAKFNRDEVVCVDVSRTHVVTRREEDA